MGIIYRDVLFANNQSGKIILPLGGDYGIMLGIILIC
jgi:hypothetical protein